MAAQPYVDSRMQEWRMGEQSRRIQTCVRRVLSELQTEALLRLRDPRLEVVVLPDDERSVWASFPIRPAMALCLSVADLKKALRFGRLLAARTRTAEELEDMATKEHEAGLCFFRLSLCMRLIALGMRPKPQTRILLVFSTADAETERRKVFEDQIRNHLGHVLLYLRSPMARNERSDAMKEWRMSIRPKARRKKAAKRKG